MHEVFYPGDVDVIIIRERVQHFNDGRFDEFQRETANTAAPVHKHTHQYTTMITNTHDTTYNNKHTHSIHNNDIQYTTYNTNTLTHPPVSPCL